FEIGAGYCLRQSNIGPLKCSLIKNHVTLRSPACRVAILGDIFRRRHEFGWQAKPGVGMSADAARRSSCATYDSGYGNSSAVSVAPPISASTVDIFSGVRVCLAIQ